ncbi:spore germination lipoprotein GerD [Paraliobacillus zengyii]|uniref:spore germination lipoprotein GerD n=1 Tax=Paraliobacillus zengyii TaxID=2213194 RepID=UPI000DD30067|nr:spore germination lipoprotein GerD [Paraliobacillus zengyii]
MIKKICMLSFTTLFILSACGGNGETSGSNQETYDTTKKMVTDILKTDEGKKAITDVLADEEMQKTYVIESQVLEDAISEALTSDKGKEFWNKMFSDQKFVEGFAQSMIDQQEAVIKGLMSDPEYQKKMLELLANPEMEKQITTVIKGQQFREHLQETIQETMNSPLFKAEMTDVILKAAEEMKASESKGGAASESEEGSG